MGDSDTENGRDAADDAAPAPVAEEDELAGGDCARCCSASRIAAEGRATGAARNVMSEPEPSAELLLAALLSPLLSLLLSPLCSLLLPPLRFSSPPPRSNAGRRLPALPAEPALPALPPLPLLLLVADMGEVERMSGGICTWKETRPLGTLASPVRQQRRKSATPR